jgi:hypothetical protein
LWGGQRAGYWLQKSSKNEPQFSGSICVWSDRLPNLSKLPLSHRKDASHKQTDCRYKLAHDNEYSPDKRSASLALGSIAADSSGASSLNTPLHGQSGLSAAVVPVE